MDLLGHHLGRRVGQREHDRARGHGADGGRRHGARSRHAEQHVGAGQQLVGGAGEVIGVGALRQRGSRGIEIRAAAVQRAVHVADDDVPRALGQQDVRAGRAGRARSGDHDADVLDPLADDHERVEERGQDDDRGPVLVVVEDGDLELVTQPPLDLEAARRGDVLEVDAAEGRRDGLDDGHDLFDVGGGETEGEGIDAGELAEQQRLALHRRAWPRRGRRRRDPQVLTSDERVGELDRRRRARRRACRPSRGRPES